MLSHKSKHKGKTTGQSNDWSERAWDPTGQRWYRTRLGSRGQYVYDYNCQDAESESERIPRTQPDSGSASSGIRDETTTGPPYHESDEYGYQQASEAGPSSANALSDNLSRLPEDTSGGQFSTSLDFYDNNRFSNSYRPAIGNSIAYPIEHAISPSATVSTAKSTNTYGYNMADTVGDFAPAHGSGSVMQTGRDYFSEQGTGYDTSNQGPYYDNYVPPMTARNNPQSPLMASNRGPSSVYAPTTFSNYGALPPSGGADLMSAALTLKPPHMTIRGTGGKEGATERLDKNFKVQNSSCFVPGHIFKVLWSEPKGVNYTNATPAYTDVTKYKIGGSRLGEDAYHSIRRFVIMATDHGHSQCVPILTYQGQGIKKPGIVGSGAKRFQCNDHAIIYTGESPPSELDGEPEFVLKPIQVIGYSPRHKLQKESRINYAKIYTVEHNVKVQFIASVASGDLQRLVTDFDTVWHNKIHINTGHQE